MQYTRFIYLYMGFSGFSIFFLLAGIIWLQLFEALDLAIDAFSFLFILYNFSVRCTKAFAAMLLCAPTAWLGNRMSMKGLTMRWTCTSLSGICASVRGWVDHLVSRNWALHRWWG